MNRLRAPFLEEAESPGPFLSSNEILKRPLPGLARKPATRALVRFFLWAFRDRILGVDGAERLHPAQDPFILALNHSQRAEAILIPALLSFLRDGRLVHFLADWNFMLIPGIGFVYRCGEVIPLGRKPAKPRFLNVFRPLLVDAEAGFLRARQRLNEGRSLGIFPEGTVNRDPSRLLRGYSGAAHLSLTTGVPILPAGIRFPGLQKGQRIPGNARFFLSIGERMTPPSLQGEPSTRMVRDWHAKIMEAIAGLSGKPWNMKTPRRSHVVEG